MLLNYIGGQWTPSSSLESIPIINPANGEEIDRSPQGSEDDVAAAVSAAKHAYLDWSQSPAVDRIQYFFRLKDALEKETTSLARCITQEHGKTLAESLGSVRRAIQMVETACAIPTLSMGEHFEDIAQGIDCATSNRSMGVFACITPFNFPIMIPFWFWPFAVACGNTYIIKASEQVPLTAQLVFTILEEVGFPPGVVNLVNGDAKVAEALCLNPDIAGISFVGSTPIAKHVYTLASSSGKRVQALGGSKNVMVAMPDSVSAKTRNKTVATTVESITGCAGERCLAGSIVLCVGKTNSDLFAAAIVEMCRSFKVGDGMRTDTSMGPLISQAAKERVTGLIERAVANGAKLLLDGRKGFENTPGFFLGPTVLAEINADMEIAQTEIFGPVVLLSTVESLDAAIDWINSIPYANTATIFTQSGAFARHFAHHVHPNMVGVNIGVPAPMSFFSFGGSKQSFFGDLKAHGKQSIRFFTDCHTTISRWHSDAEIW